ncbi:hypothetical protein G6F61_014488 [Rhizopus arrhizus]|nr:hypothetical protein G6F61_014488 [Rhizopus arrhizus]
MAPQAASANNSPPTSWAGSMPAASTARIEAWARRPVSVAGVFMSCLPSVGRWEAPVAGAPEPHAAQNSRLSISRVLPRRAAISATGPPPSNVGSASSGVRSTA